jgi:hypothetical protein
VNCLGVKPRGTRPVPPVDWLDLKYDWFHREQRKSSRKEKESTNYEKQRQKIAKVKRHIWRTVLDYQPKLMSNTLQPASVLIAAVPASARTARRDTHSKFDSPWDEGGCISSDCMEG